MERCARLAPCVIREGWVVSYTQTSNEHFSVNKIISRHLFSCKIANTAGLIILTH